MDIVLCGMARGMSYERKGYVDKPFVNGHIDYNTCDIIQDLYEVVLKVRKALLRGVIRPEMVSKSLR